MKRLIIFIAILVACPLFWQSCIEDESVGIVRDLVDIEIKTERDTFYADFGLECRFSVEVSQSEDMELEYEWKVASLEQKDTLEVVCTEPEFRYAFKDLGEFRVRLKVTNRDGSSYHFFTAFVRTPYEDGLLVLSEDNNRVGRTSFLRVIKHPDEIVNGNETFNTRLLEGINPEFPLQEVKDVTWYDNKIYLLTDGGKKINVYDMHSLDYINFYDVDQDNPGLRLRCFSQSDVPFSMGEMIMIGEEGGTWIFNLDTYFLMPDTKLYPGKRFDKLYSFSIGGGDRNALLVNFEDSYICHQVFGSWPGPSYNSGSYFRDRRILNLMADHECRLKAITTDPQDPLAVKITTFDAMGQYHFFVGFSGAFDNPNTVDYRAASPLTLTREVDMLTNSKYYVAYYPRGGELYEWVYSGESPKLPDDPVWTTEGEITCMALCPNGDKRYLYLGIWNPAAQEELKGSVYIMDVVTHKILKEYRGIADKPFKIIYKTMDDSVYW